MDLLRIPPKLYFKRGCLPVALREMKEVYNLNGAYIITSPDLFRKGVLYEASSLLEKSGLGTCEYFTLDKELTVDNVKAGLPKMHEFDPDLIVGIGDEAALNAAKIMWLLYENPEADLAALAGDAAFPQLGTKAKLVLIPTAGGTGSACAPYASILDGGKKLQLKSYNLIPLMAVIDPQLGDYQVSADIKADGLLALKTAVAAYVAPAKIDYGRGFAIDATKLVLKNLKAAMAGGEKAPDAYDAIANAVTLAGIGYACTTVMADPMDAAAKVEDLVKADKAAADELAAHCGLADAKALVAEYNKLAKL